MDGTYLSTDFGQGQTALDMKCEEDLDAWPRLEWAPSSSDLPLKYPVHGLNLIRPKPIQTNLHSEHSEGSK